jgi:X-X-X-Leu-X-X-Gly heptad repeat protein
MINNRIVRATAGICALATFATFMACSTAAGVPSPDVSGTAAGGGTRTVESAADTASLLAAKVSKQEVVYVKTAADGVVRGVFVMNIFASEQDAAVTDYGAYNKVVNLTDTQQLSQGADERGFKVPADREYYYQGELPADVELPWDVAVSYELDGVPTAASQLGGVDGELVMRLKITPRQPGVGEYADNYLLQVNGTLSADKATELTAADATLARSGDDVKLSYLVFPGKSVEYTVRARVHDFSFDGWQVVGIPLAIMLDVDATGVANNSDLSKLKDAISTLNDGVAKLSEGATAMKSGIGKLSSSGTKLSSASKQVSKSLASVATGAQALSDAMGGLLLPGVEKLAAGSVDFKSGLKAEADAARDRAKKLDAASKQAEQALKNARAAADNASDLVAGSQASASAALQAAYQKLGQGGAIDKDDLDAIAQELRAANNGLAAAGRAAEAIAQASTKLIEAQVGARSYQAVATALDSARESYKPLDSGLRSLADPKNPAGLGGLLSGAGGLASGVSELQRGYSDFDNGLSGYLGGVNTFTSKYGAFSGGIRSLATGAAELSSKTADIDQKMVDAVQEQLREYLNPNYSPVSFVDSRNRAVSRVQFVYMTDVIAKPKAPKPPADATKEQPSFWDRFIGLFGSGG